MFRAKIKDLEIGGNVQTIIDDYCQDTREGVYKYLESGSTGIIIKKSSKNDFFYEVDFGELILWIRGENLILV